MPQMPMACWLPCCGLTRITGHSRSGGSTDQIVVGPIEVFRDIRLTQPARVDFDEVASPESFQAGCHSTFPGHPGGHSRVVHRPDHLVDFGDDSGLFSRCPPPTRGVVDLQGLGYRSLGLP